MARQIESFRPYLTGAEILCLLEALENRTDSLSVSVRHKLGLFKYKITHSIVAPAAIRAPKETLAQKLGLETVTVSEKESELTKMASALQSKKDIMSPQEIYDAYVAKLGKGDTLTEEEMLEANKVEFGIYGMNIMFILP